MCGWMMMSQRPRISRPEEEKTLQAQSSTQETHILTVTHIAKQLGADIQALQVQIAQRDSVASGTTAAVQSLDQKNTAGIGDLRGRVARCDASIAKLSADVSSGEKQLIRRQQEVTDLRSAVDVRIRELEVKLHHELDRLEAAMSGRSEAQRSSVSDLRTQVTGLEVRMSRDLKEQTDSLRKWTEQELRSSARRAARQQQETLEAESRSADRLRALETRVQQLEAQLETASRSQTDRLKRCETELSRRWSSAESRLQQELQLLKQEHGKGFLSVHGAIESLRQISDIKSHLDRKELQKDLREAEL